MSSPRQPDDPWSTFALSVFKLNGLLIQAGEGITAPIGQTSARWQVLGRAVPPATVAAMARQMGQARQSVQRVADVLAAEGLVAFHEHPTDKRTKLVALTPQGMNVMKAIYARQLDWSDRILAYLDVERLVKLSKELQRVADVLEESLGSLGSSAPKPRRRVPSRTT